MPRVVQNLVLGSIGIGLPSTRNQFTTGNRSSNAAIQTDVKY
jgi:hypothetical protein